MFNVVLMVLDVFCRIQRRIRLWFERFWCWLNIFLDHVAHLWYFLHLQILLCLLRCMYSILLYIAVKKHFISCLLLHDAIGNVLAFSDSRLL